MTFKVKFKFKIKVKKYVISLLTYRNRTYQGGNFEMY